MKNSKSPVQGKSRKKREKLKASTTEEKVEKNVKNSKSPAQGKKSKKCENLKSPIPVLREMLRKKS